ncbi:hypothetical protein [Neptunicella sp. SCSIO 80796]|uniref:hypothetical protein n=1 Tax=Neptunicella plasticusilytica TaxID=3117012 RepID=UPI003A4DED89
MTNHTHPDYDPEVMIMTDITAQQVSKIIDELAEDVAEQEDEAALWLGTLQINGQRAQVQLLVTTIDSHFVDEN